VPLLQLDDGTRLREGPAIVQYIADQAPAKNLAPANGTLARYQLQSWLTFVGMGLHGKFGPLFTPGTPQEVKTAANQWRYEVMYDGNAADIGGAGNNPIANGAITFNTDGTIATPAANVNVTIPFVASSGLSSQNIAFNFGTPGQANGFTQFDTTSSLYSSNIDGTLYGGLSGVRIDDQGFVVAQFTNGIERNLYKLPVATFANADGLGLINGNSFRQTSQSGGPSLKNADEAGAGKIASKSVEQSTVDIAEEFSDMIIIQRAYSAASKIITTADEMLDELTRLKR
jgi:flagellar hook protein FlgE